MRTKIILNLQTCALQSINSISVSSKRQKKFSSHHYNKNQPSWALHFAAIKLKSRLDYSKISKFHHACQQ